MTVRLIKSGTCAIAIQVQKYLETFYGINMSVQTVRNILRRHGCVGRVKVKKALLGKKASQSSAGICEKIQILDHGRLKRRSMVRLRQIQYFESHGKEYYWRKPGEPLGDEHVKPTVKFGGGSIMVWGCMTYQGAGYLCKIDNGLDAKLYRRILNGELVETLNIIKWTRNILHFNMIMTQNTRQT